MEKVYLEDYDLGEKFVTPGRTITEADIVMFAAITGDWWEGHTNAEWAKTGQFGERIAHGMLTLVIGAALPWRLGPHVYSPKGFIAFYGMDKIRYTAPVKIGDTIRCELIVTGLEPKDDKRGNLVYQTNILNQRDELVMTGTQKLLVARKPKE